MNIRKHALVSVSCAALAVVLAGTPAHAAITISTDTTQNMSCSGGVCAPTATDAVLNVTDLENYLAAGNLEVTTAGSGVDAEDIDFEAALTWSNTSALSLMATQAVTIDQPVSVTGVGGLSVTTDGQNEDFSIGSSGHVTFANLSSGLNINGQAYTLERSIKSLAKAIANNQSGNFALAKSIDAKKEDTYRQPPVETLFYGSFEGLGNTIDHLRVRSGDGGLFQSLAPGSAVRNLGLRIVSIISRQEAGGLAAVSYAYVSHCFASGTVVGGLSASAGAGGLIGANGGTVSDSYSSADVTGNPAAIAGGLVGLNAEGATIQSSFATGSVTATVDSKHNSTQVGGLVGLNEGAITNSYSTGSVTGGEASTVGGLLGDTEVGVTNSYSTGQVSGFGSRYLGGFVGYDYLGGQSDDYWDTDSSGISNLSQGAGYPSNDPGINGLTTQQLQSGLPSGFDPSVWAEDSSINNGLPYLLANPPPK